MLKKHIRTGIVILCTILALSACSINEGLPETSDNNPQPIKPNITMELEKEKQWDVKHIAFKNKPVTQVQVTEGGEVFVLSNGQLYRIDEKKNIKKVSKRKDISTFYILETNEVLKMFLGCSNGKLFVATVGEEEKEANLGAFEAPISKICGSLLSKEVYIGQSSKYGGGLWKSTDQGKTWTKLTDTTVRGITIHPYEPNIVYIVDKQTYYSEDKGQTFLKINTEANYGLLISHQCPEAAYHAYSKGVFITDKNGNKSSHLKFSLNGSMTRLEINPKNICHWLMGIWNYPSGVGGLYYSNNSGGLWQTVEAFNNNYIHDIAYSSSGTVAYIGTKKDGLWAINCNLARQNDSE